MEIFAKKSSILMVVLLILFGSFFPISFGSSASLFQRLKGENNIQRVPITSSPVHLRRHLNHVILDNGIIEATFSSPDGHITGIKYDKIDNVFNHRIKERDGRGYWDIFWNEPGDPQKLDRLPGAKFSVVLEDEDQIEISFSRIWDFSQRRVHVPLNIDKRYILRRGSSGIYAYSILERLPEWPTVNMDAITLILKLQQNEFQFMALSDDRQKVMATDDDRNRGKVLDYKEAVHLTNPKNSALKGQVDDKYQYTSEDQDNKVHGWISDNSRVGFWMITPSDEFRSGGPIKQDLTSHVGTTTLNVFMSGHYVGNEMNTTFEIGESWKKVFGPVLIYMNSDSSHDYRSNLWNDAKRQMSIEVESWPYEFPRSKDFPSAKQRGSVNGQLLVRDRYSNISNMPAINGYIGLTVPGEVGSWQREHKGYQFWTRTDQTGNFIIKNVRVGNYNLYGWVPGFIGDYKYEADITITPGGEIKLGSIVYEPPRNGPTLWEIGIPNRKADEFFIPDPDPKLMTKLYTKNPEKFRQYGLWNRYTELYPRHDLVYNVGTSSYAKDWFFAQVVRNIGNQTWVGTTWQINFELKHRIESGYYTLQLALASSNTVHLNVGLNRLSSYPNRPDFTTGPIGGRDNAIARHGSHGLYRLYTVLLQSNKLNVGRNTIYLNQPKGGSPFVGLMYDYIRLEGPPTY